MNIQPELHNDFNRALQKALNNPNLPWKFEPAPGRDDSKFRLILSGTLEIQIPVLEEAVNYEIPADGWYVGGMVLDREDLTGDTQECALRLLSRLIKNGIRSKQTALIMALEGLGRVEVMG